MIADLARLCLLGLAGMAGCAAVPEYQDEPARIVDPDDASRAALRATIVDALGIPVTISDAAFTESSVLVIERLPTPTMENPVPLGRVIEVPIRFRLVRNGAQCVLVSDQDHERYVLRDTRCMPE